MLLVVSGPPRSIEPQQGLAAYVHRNALGAVAVGSCSPGQTCGPQPRSSTLFLTVPDLDVIQVCLHLHFHLPPNPPGCSLNTRSAFAAQATPHNPLWLWRALGSAGIPLRKYVLEKLEYSATSAKARLQRHRQQTTRAIPRAHLNRRRRFRVWFALKRAFVTGGLPMPVIGVFQKRYPRHSSDRRSFPLAQLRQHYTLRLAASPQAENRIPKAYIQPKSGARHASRIAAVTAFRPPKGVVASCSSLVGEAALQFWTWSSYGNGANDHRWNDDRRRHRPIRSISAQCPARTEGSVNQRGPQGRNRANRRICFSQSDLRHLSIDERSPRKGFQSQFFESVQGQTARDTSITAVLKVGVPTETVTVSAGFRSLTEAIDTTTPAGRMMMQVVGAFAAFERAMLKERTKAGLEAARREGRIGGAPAKAKLSPAGRDHPDSFQRE